MNAQSLGTIREFHTANFKIVVDALEDYDADLSWDTDGSVLRDLQSGALTCFTARVRVLHKTLGTVGTDYLGSCIYKRIEDFQDHRECAKQTRELRAKYRRQHKRGAANVVCGSYFSDMIREAISEARKHLRSAQSIHVRVAA
jgi:hypothetical protein